MELQLDPDRLLPVDPATRAVARSLYDRVAQLPIISPHGHVAPSLLRDDAPFSDPTNLLITYDHYVTRLLHAAGVDLAEIGAGTAAEADPRAVWRLFCENWHLYYGTASGYWLTHELVTLFGITTEPSAESADALYDEIAGRLALADFRPRALFERFGPDTGHDIPVRTEYTKSLQPLLNAYGLEKDFHLVLFGVDETVFSREIAPLAGFYPSVYIGAPWWFLDAPDAVHRFRSAVTETAGFYRGSGFIDDTRAFLSIPARHDMARRLDAGFLARLAREGRLTPAQAERIAVDLVDSIPRKVFKL